MGLTTHNRLPLWQIVGKIRKAVLKLCSACSCRHWQKGVWQQTAEQLIVMLAARGAPWGLYLSGDSCPKPHTPHEWHDKRHHACQAFKGLAVQVDFEKVPDLVAQRRVLLRRGTAYVSRHETASLVVRPCSMCAVWSMTSEGSLSQCQE